VRYALIIPRRIKILLAAIGLFSRVVIAATGDIDGGIGALRLGWDDNPTFRNLIAPRIHDSRLAADLPQRSREVYFCGKSI
jgi:hypothetical protein